MRVPGLIVSAGGEVIGGNLLQMAFRFWAFRRFVLPDEYELRQPMPDSGNVTPMRQSRRLARRQLGDSSDPRVSKTS